MKFKGQGKKEYLVYRLDDYANDWVVYSVPVTIGQANWIVNTRPSQKWDIRKIEKEQK